MDVASILILLVVIGLFFVGGFVLLGGRAKLKREAQAARESPGSDEDRPLHHAVGTPQQLEELGRRPD